jgi:hypothetical protein
MSTNKSDSPFLRSSRAPGDDLDAQRRYVESLEAKGFGYDLAVGDAFVRGMRDIGYKSTSYAVAEIADNSSQANATRCDVLLHGPDGHLAEIVAVDNGHGMEPKMLRVSLIWGGGHRTTRDDGLGKYGYGLPSSSVSQCQRVEVYSIVESGEWHRAYLDINEIREGEWNHGNRIQMPRPERVDPPEYVLDYLQDAYDGGYTHGTVVLWKDCDRLDYVRRSALKSSLLTDLGVIYRNFLRNMSMSVDGEDVQPCDPLFLTEGARYFDLDEDRAVALPSVTIDVNDKKTGDFVGQMRVRYSRLPATYFRVPEQKKNYKIGTSGMNERLSVADKHLGIIFLRAGRQIDVVRPPRNAGITSINATTDRFWNVEVDFDPSLDGEFHITTSKQQVVPSERIWAMLNDKANLAKAIAEMRRVYAKESLVIRAEAEETKKRASEAIKKEAARFKTNKAAPLSDARKKEADENADREVKRRANMSGKKIVDERRDFEAEVKENPDVVLEEDLTGAPFYRAELRGAQKVLWINRAHQFYSEVYAGPEASPRLRTALELLLWALVEGELDATDDRRMFYVAERQLWSQTVATYLDLLQKTPLLEEVPAPSPEDSVAGDASAA